MGNKIPNPIINNDDVSALIVATLAEQKRQDDAIAAQQKKNELVEKELKTMELKAQIMIDEVGIRNKLKKLDLERGGMLGALVGKWQKELDFAKEMHKHESVLVKDEQMREALEKKIAEYEGKQEEATVQHIKNLLVQHGINADINKQIAASAQNVSVFKKFGSTIGGLMSSPMFGVGQAMSNMFLKIGSVFWDAIKGVLEFFWNRIKEVFDVFLAMQKVVGGISADLGLSAVQTNMLKSNMGAIGMSALKFGVTFEEAVGFMRTFSDLTGLNRVFLGKEVEDLSAVAKATGLGVEETGKMYAQMELVGMSTSQFHKYVTGAIQSAGVLNLNVTKVLKTVEGLLPAFRGLNFRDGIEGLTKIVETAQGLRFNLDNMRSLANKVFNPEGAIELAAKLRVLGGGFARIADPFSLMLKGQTDAAGLMKDVMSTFSGLATRDAKGIFSIPPVQQALIREAAEAMGENADNMISGALQMAKQSDIMSHINPMAGMTEDDRKMVANLAEMRDGKYVVKVDAAGMEVAVDNLSTTQLNAIRALQDNEEKNARARMNIVEQFQNIYQIFLTALSPVFQKISDVLTKKGGFMESLASKASEFGSWLASKLDGIFNGGMLNTLFDKLEKLFDDVLALLTGKESITQKLIDIVSKVLSAALTTVLPIIAGAINDSGLGGAPRTTGGIFGGLGGAALATMIAGAIVAATGVGVVPGVAIIAGAAAVGGGGGYLLGHGVMSGVISPDKTNMAPVHDAIVSSEGKVTPYSKGDLAMLIDQKSVTESMTPSRDMLNQVKTYKKESFNPFNVSAGGGNNAPQKVSFDISGTLQIKGDDNTAYLTSADLKNIGIQELTYLILNETDRYKNHQSGKRLQSEIISPIRST